MAIPDLDIDLEQNLTLAQVLELSNKLDLSLHEAGPPEPMTGLRGMMLADRILKEREGIGMLIGSAATAVWLKRSKNPAEALEACKDIDVAVLEDTGSPPAPLPELEKFEGGIDWWLPVKDPIEYQDGDETCTTSPLRYVNGNGVVLYFIPSLRHQLSPGLYIPSSERVCDMRFAETASTIPSFVDGLIFEFEPKTRRALGMSKTVWIPELRAVFPGQIAGGKHGANITPHGPHPFEVNSMFKPDLERILEASGSE